MNLSHIEHLGIAVKSLEEAIPYYENVLGLKCYAVEEVADQKVKTAFFKIGQTKIELLEPTSPESTIASFIEKRGEGIHHLAFATDDDRFHPPEVHQGCPHRILHAEIQRVSVPYPKTNLKQISNESATRKG